MILDDYRGTWEDEDISELRKLTREFIANEITPHQERFAQQHRVDRNVWRKAGQAGLLCISVPEEYGGGGGDFRHEAVVLHEQGLAFDDAWGYSVHSSICAHYILEYGTEEQKKAWLPKLASGEYVAAIAMTEPGTGSDLQAVRTKAVRDGDEWVINGSKTFITNGTHCDLVIIVARTSDEPGAKGISLIVAEVGGEDVVGESGTWAPGFERGRVLDKMGMRGQDTRELFFTDMRVPVGNVLGGEAGEGKGFYQLMNQLPQERLAIAVGGAGVAEAAVRAGIAYAKDREAFGVPIVKFQNTKFVLAEASTEALAVRTFVDHAIAEHTAGELSTEKASAAKYWATDMQNTIVDKVLQVFGGYGFMNEYPIARAYASSRVQKIYGGTNEIMKELIGRGL